MQSIEFLYWHNPVLFYIFLCLLSLCIGSFFNVLVYRLPKMLAQQWRGECYEFLEITPKNSPTEPAISLTYPSSQCPNCQTPIRFWQNIPVLSFLLLRGRCAHCHVQISWRYPFVESITALFSIICFTHFGLTADAVWATVLCWSLLCLTLIDLDEQILPDNLTLPLLWLGLLININGTFVSLSDAVIGAVVGYSALWLFMRLFQAITGKQGMGHGDFKLLATLGAWFGWQLIPQMILVSSIFGTLLGSLYLALQAKDKQTPIAFGPYIALAGIIALFFGQQINEAYLSFAGFKP